MKLKIGIIGCGGIANGKHMPALKKVNEIKIVAFCDVIEERAIKAKSEFGDESSKIYTDYRELLKNKEIDIVHVCTPNSSHAEISVASMEADKHVMCEKPMAINSKEGRSMLEASKKTGKKLTIGYQNRFRNDSKFLYEACQDGDLGEVYLGKAKAIRRRAVPTWGVFLDEEAQGGGPLIDIGTHALDLTLWMMDNYKPKYVVGNTYHKLSKTKNAANAWGPWDTEKFTVEDSAFGFITMENGASIILESSWALNTLNTGEARTSLCGTKGGADMEDGLRINGEERGVLYDKKIQLDADGVDFYDGASDDPAYTEAQSWINCILNDTEPVVTPEQALAVTEILEAIYESSKSGEPIFLKEKINA